MLKWGEKESSLRLCSKGQLEKNDLGIRSPMSGVKCVVKQHEFFFFLGGGGWQGVTNL